MPQGRSAYDGAVRIYLVRHGDAVPEEEAGSDRDRWLSPRGREAARVLARLLREQGVAPEGEPFGAARDFKPVAFTVDVSGGVGRGRPIIFIPGLGCPGHVWDEVV